MFHMIQADREVIDLVAVTRLLGSVRDGPSGTPRCLLDISRGRGSGRAHQPPGDHRVGSHHPRDGSTEIELGWYTPRATRPAAPHIREQLVALPGTKFDRSTRLPGPMMGGDAAMTGDVDRGRGC